jgi:subtilisin family serine protease
MIVNTSPWRLVLVLLFAVVAGTAAAQGKPRIDKAADLPKFTYKIDGKVEDVVRSKEKFAPFAAAVRRDTESVLANYDIPDKATRSSLVGLLATLDYLDGRYDSTLARVAELRALQDKPADKLVAGLRLKAMALAAKADGPSGDAYQRDLAAGMRRELEPLPYALVENNVKEGKEGAELMGEALILGRIREVVQPIVDQNGALSSDFAPGIVSARFALLDVLPLKQTLVGVYSTYLAAHQVAKADIWAARDVVLTPAQTRGTVVLGIWDSGVDTALYPGQVVRNGDQPAVIAFDKYSKPSSGQLMPLPLSAQGRIAEMTGRIKGFSDLQSNIDSKEASAVKAYLSGLTPDQYKPAIEELNMAGDFSHGTHVAGIALAGNPAARLVIGRIEFGYTLKPDPCPSSELAERDARASQAYVDFFKAQHARVVNMSWGGSVGDFESDLEKCGIGKTADERKALARKYFDIQKDSLTKAFASAPQILFVTAAGNSNDDASFTENVPSGIVLPNLLTVGAVDSAGEEASFTSYGPTVKVHADGYQVESYLPGGAKVALSGTSMASPEVTNLAGKLLAVNPKLTPTELIRIITDTADRSADGRRNLVNPKKALAAALAA